MKTFLACLLLSSVAVAHAEEIYARFIFPPFANEDVKIPTHTLSDYPDYEEMQSITVEEWRSIMTTGNSSVQEMAAKELLKRGDQQTILRLIYSLKQGNVFAIGALSASTLVVIPYLMEDVAQGSLAYYGSYDFGDAFTSSGRVREAAVERVGSILFSATEFTGETRDCLRAICRERSDKIQALSEKSRYLLQWWLLNKDAFEAGKWDQTRPLPYEISYPDPKSDRTIPPDEGWDPKKQPPFGSPLWTLPEPFEAWAARIVDPERRNLDFVALSWDGKKVIEHSAKSLDPKATDGTQQDRESRKIPAPRNPPEPESGKMGRGVLWVTGCAALMLMLSIVWWMKRKTEADF